jgi:hypothetical protein
MESLAQVGFQELQAFCLRPACSASLQVMGKDGLFVLGQQVIRCIL